MGESGGDSDHVSVCVAQDELNGEGPPRRSSPSVSRPVLSDAELIDAFWTDAGFPSPSSRVWERGSASGAGESDEVVLVCKENREGLRQDSPPRVSQGSNSSSSGLRLARAPPRMGPWRGPLPPRRVTPPPVLGVFIDKAVAVRDGPSSLGSPSLVAAASSSSAPADPSITELGAVRNSNSMQVGPRCQVEDRNRPSPWAHLHRPCRPCPSSSAVRCGPFDLTQRRQRLASNSLASPTSSSPEIGRAHV